MLYALGGLAGAVEVQASPGSPLRLATTVTDDVYYCRT